ncbi:MAG: pilin, partial [Patescibacteria group bacterium]
DWQTKLDSGVNKTELYETGIEDPQSRLAIYIGSILLILPFLGIVFIIQMIYAGYQWMTASGDSEKIKKAQQRIFYAIIGLVILAALYLIAYFVINMLSGATGYNSRLKNYDYIPNDYPTADPLPENIYPDTYPHNP